MTSKRPCWGSKTKAFLSAGKKNGHASRLNANGSNFQVRSTPVLGQLLVCKWRHSGHVGGQKQKLFSPLGNQLYFDANFTKKFLLYWPPTWPPCHVVANQEFIPGTIHEEPTPAGNVHWPKSLWAPVMTSVWIQKSMSNQWVINWLVIDYRRWSMCNRSMINRQQKYCGLSITHDVIDYPSMSLIIHWCYLLLIEYLLITHCLLINYHVSQLLQLITNFQYFSLFKLPFLAQICILNSSHDPDDNAWLAKASYNDDK